MVIKCSTYGIINISKRAYVQIKGSQVNGQKKLRSYHPQVATKTTVPLIPRKFHNIFLQGILSIPSMRCFLPLYLISLLNYAFSSKRKNHGASQSHNHSHRSCSIRPFITYGANIIFNSHINYNIGKQQVARGQKMSS